MPEQSKNKKWIKPGLVSLGKHTPDENIEPLSDAIKRVLHMSHRLDVEESGQNSDQRPGASDDADPPIRVQFPLPVYRPAK